MFDAHYDLLTIAYKAYLTKDYSYLEKISKDIQNNVRCVIANLYFMSREEMACEICENYYSDDVSVLEMFKIAKRVLDLYLPNVSIIYSIEGADYIKDCFELEQLYDAGLDCFMLCWNNENKYGSGNRSDKGLTEEGKKLINKAIDLGMGIDLSHANYQTFCDLVNIVKKRQEDGEAVCVFASHSNSRMLCDVSRNLDDKQLYMLKDISGLVGVMSHKKFVCNLGGYDINYKRAYLDHIKHIASIVGVENTMIATDDMSFCSDYDFEYKDVGIYDYSTVFDDLFFDLSSEFGVFFVTQVMYDNPIEKIYKNLNDKRLKGRKIK